MFDITIHFDRLIEREQERSDEGELQIAGVTIVHGVVAVNMVTVSLKQLRPVDYLRSWPDYLGTYRNPIQIATISEENPYFAYVIRAIERDNSNDRAGDLARFENSVVQSAQLVVDGGGLPTVDAIWLGGNAPSLADRRWRDDDDKIGVSARTYVDYGTILAEPNPLIDPPVPGSRIPGGSQSTELLFRGSGASWRIYPTVEASWTM